jgi:predicted secreted protein
LRAAVAERFMLISRSPGILEQVSARPAQSWIRIVSASGVLACLAAACSSSPSVLPAPAPDRTSPPAAQVRAEPAVTKAAPHRPPRVIASQIRTPDGSVVTVASFRGSVQYVLHNGSQDPGPRYAALVQAGPAVRGAERRRLLAAFNGGFLLRSRAGGYEQEGHVFRSLRHGLASLVIDRSGQARIGIWGVDLPGPGEAVYSVRQNLWPLVEGGQPTREAARWYRWGGTIGHAEYVARSALGQDAAGNLIYAASMSTVPEDLARVLARSGARIAMELDINPEWVQLAIASTPGGSLRAPIPGQVRSATQYLTGWTRDFITVLAAS